MNLYNFILYLVSLNYFEYFDLSTLKSLGIETQKITLELPQWMLNAINKEAKLLGFESQSLINIYLAQHYYT
jgi:hypothetical protein